MKKIYLAAMAVAALTVSSCSQDEVLNINPEAGAKAIEFGVYTGKAAQTRGTITDISTVAADGFGVSAVWSAAADDATAATTWTSTGLPNFMYNEKVSSEQTAAPYTWKYNPVKYWPTDANDVVSFFAYAPYTTSSDNNGISVPDNGKTPHNNIVYTLQDDPCNNADFVAAAVYNKGKTNENPAKPVSLMFNHELTRVDIKAKLDEKLAEDAATHVVITDVQIYGAADKLMKKATYTYGDSDYESEDNPGTWAAEEYFTATNMYKINDMVKNSTVTIEGTTFSESGFDLTTISEPVMTSIFKTKDDNSTPNYLFLLPLKDGTQANEVFMQLSYTIATKDDKLVGGYVSTPTTKTISMPAGILKQGKAYIFKITVDVDAVEFEVAVDGWDSEEYDATVDNKNNEDSFSQLQTNP